MTSSVLFLSVLLKLYHTTSRAQRLVRKIAAMPNRILNSSSHWIWRKGAGRSVVVVRAAVAASRVNVRDWVC
jgi:hypothetical protein